MLYQWVCCQKCNHVIYVYCICIYLYFYFFYLYVHFNLHQYRSISIIFFVFLFLLDVSINYYLLLYILPNLMNVVTYYNSKGISLLHLKQKNDRECVKYKLSMNKCLCFHIIRAWRCAIVLLCFGLASWLPAMEGRRLAVELLNKSMKLMTGVFIIQLCL